MLVQLLNGAAYFLGLCVVIYLLLWVSFQRGNSLGSGLIRTWREFCGCDETEEKE